MTVIAMLAAAIGLQTPVTAEARVTFDARRIVSARASGLADRTTRRAVTVDDPVRIASVSKLVVALGVMRLVEAGTLDLDADVSTYLGWRLRHPRNPETAITLRQLLSHSAGIRDGVDYAIPLGQTVQATLADPRAWNHEHRPGAYFAYANLNFPIVAAVIEAATGTRFDRLMAREVFVPLGIEACFNWTMCSDARIARAVVLHGADGSVRRDDLRGARPPCPIVADPPCDLTGYIPGTNGALFSPQGGMRISARDLARIGQMLLRRGGKFLKPASVAAMTAPAWVWDGGNGDSEDGLFCRYGLGVHLLAAPNTPGCRDDPFGDGAARVGHAGEAYGMRSGLWIDAARGRGIAYFVTGVDDAAPRGRSAFTQVEERLAREQR